MITDIDIAGISFEYGKGDEILTDFSLEIPNGNVIGLTGPSGCGKSTLLKIMAGIIAPKKGKISYLSDGFKIGYCPQANSLLPWKSTIDNVLLGCQIFDMDIESSTRRAHKLLSAFNLSQIARKFPNQLSGGMRKRVAIIRALALQPHLLLLDEPFSSIDLINKLDILQVLASQIKESGITCVFVSHDPVEIGLLADSVKFLSGPKLTIVKELSLSLDKTERICNWPENSEINLSIRTITAEIRRLEKTAN